jgi:hypothetical protein
MDTITLRFTPQRLDYIANVLIKQPYADVAPIIADMQMQVAQQNKGAQTGPQGDQQNVVVATPPPGDR